MDLRKYVLAGGAGVGRMYCSEALFDSSTAKPCPALSCRLFWIPLELEHFWYGIRKNRRIRRAMVLQ